MDLGRHSEAPAMERELHPGTVHTNPAWLPPRCQQSEAWVESPGSTLRSGAAAAAAEAAAARAAGEVLIASLGVCVLTAGAGLLGLRGARFSNSSPFVTANQISFLAVWLERFLLCSPAPPSFKECRYFSPFH